MPHSRQLNRHAILAVAFNVLYLASQCSSYMIFSKSCGVAKSISSSSLLLGLQHRPVLSTITPTTEFPQSCQSQRISMQKFSPWKSRLQSSSTSPEVVDGGVGTTNDASNESTESKSNNEQEKTRDLLSLDYIRSTLIRQEETIIFALIERAQFRQNEVVYKVGGVPGLGIPPGSIISNGMSEDGSDLSFLDFMLTGTEVLHSSVRRYESPEEHAFFPSRLPSRSNSLNNLDYPELLSDDQSINSLNWNKILYQKYKEVIVPAIATNGDDEQYGSTTLADIAALQALSKRIHFGKFVAESKYRSNPEGFQKLVNEGDAEGVMKLLTNEKVEELVLTRARLKAATYGREPMLSSLPSVGTGDDSTSIIAAAAAAAVVAAVEAVQSQKSDGSEGSKKVKGKVDPGIIESIYRQLIIPMTKDIEVAYLFLRCGKEPPAEYSSDRMSLDVTELSQRTIL